MWINISWWLKLPQMMVPLPSVLKWPYQAFGSRIVLMSLFVGELGSLPPKSRTILLFGGVTFGPWDLPPPPPHLCRIQYNCPAAYVLSAFSVRSLHTKKLWSQLICSLRRALYARIILHPWFSKAMPADANSYLFNVLNMNTPNEIYGKYKCLYSELW